MIKNKIDISVIVPVYNVEKFLPQCLDSILNQTFKNIEIILISDEGKDNSVEICKEYAKKDTRIKHIISTTKRGIGGARNIGIEQANGEYIFFIDSDDWLEINALEILLNAAKTNKTDITIFEDYYYQNITNKLEEHYTWPQAGVIELNDARRLKHHSTAWSKLYKRSFLEKNKIRFIENSYYEDNSFGALVYLLSTKITVVKRKLYYYRRWDGSNSASSQIDFFGWIADYHYLIQELVKRNLQLSNFVIALYLINFVNYLDRATDKICQNFYNEIRKIVLTWNITKETLAEVISDKKELNFFYKAYLTIKKNKNYKKQKTLYKIKIFGIPFLKITQTSNIIKTYLFSFFPLFNYKKGNNIKIKLLFTIPFIRINKKF